MRCATRLARTMGDRHLDSARCSDSSVMQILDAPWVLGQPFGVLAGASIDQLGPCSRRGRPGSFISRAPKARPNKCSSMLEVWDGRAQFRSAFR